MPRRGKSGAKAAGTRRPKAPKRRNTAPTAQRPTAKTPTAKPPTAKTSTSKTRTTKTATARVAALARITRERDEALEQQGATAEILKVISQSAFDLQAVLQALVSAAVRLCEADTGIVRRREGEFYPVAASIGFTQEQHDYFARYSVKPDRSSVYGRAILERRSIHVPDLLADPELNRDRRKDYSKVVNIRTGLGVPLLREGRIVGVFTLQRRKRRPYTKKQIELAETFANQAVIAIENSRLIDEVQARTRDLSEALEQQTATSEVLEVISSSPGELQPVFGKMLENAVRVCEATFGILNLWDGAHFRTMAGYNVPPAFAAVRRDKPIEPHPDSLLFKVLETHKLVHVHDARIASGYLAGAPNAVEMVEVAGARTVLIVPMLKEDDLIGTFTIFRQEVRPFTDKQIALLENFTKQAVIAIENTRLINETKEALERQTATAEILKVIASSPSDVQPVFEAIVASAARLIGAFSAGVYRFVDGMVHLAAVTSIAPAADAVLRDRFPRPIEGTGFTTTFSGGVFTITDIESHKDEALRDVARARGFRSLLQVPLRSAGASIGAIAVARKEPGPFAAHHIDLLQTFADQAVIAIENVRLFNETQEALARQTATADVLKVIASSPSNLRPVFDAIAQRSKALIGAHATTVLRYVDGMIELGAFTPISPEADALLLAMFPRRPTAEHEAVLRGEIARFPDVELEIEDPAMRSMARARGWRSRLYVPLKDDGGVAGWISVTRREAGEFAEKDVELLQTFADQAVIAIGNVRLFDEVQARTRDLQESLQQQTATADVLKVISRSAFDLDSVLSTLVASATRLCEAERGLIFLRDGDFFRNAANYGFSPELEAFARANPLPADGRSTTARAGASGLPVQAVDLLADETQGDLAREYQRLGGHRTNLGVPLRRNGETIGVFTLTRQVVQAFSQRQIDLVQTFADQAVIAIENSRLLDQVQAKTRDLEESLQQQTATSDVLKVISRSAFDLEVVLNTLTESAARLCDADMAAIARQHANGGYFHATRYNFAPEWERLIESVRLHPDRGSLIGRVLLTGSTVQIPDVLADPEYTYPEHLRVGGYRTLLGVPMLRGGQPIGVLFLGRNAVLPFTDRQIDLLQTFADQAVIAIENVRLFDEVQAKTRDLSEALTYQTGSANILKVIASSPTDVQPVMNAIVESACELCGAYDAVALLKEGDDLLFSAHHGPIPMHSRKRSINRNWTAGRAFIDKKAIHVHDLQAEADEFPEGMEMARDMGHRSIVSVPLLREGESIGALVLRRLEVNPFSEKQIALLQTFADQAVIAIGNVQLFDEVQAKTRDLSEALTYQTGSANILKVIASSPTDIEPVLKAIVESACELCGAYDAVLRLKKGDQLVIGAHHGIVPADWELVQINPNWTAGRAVIERRPVHVHDMSSSEGDAFPEAQARAREQGHRTILSIPLLQDDNIIGTFTLRRLEVHPFTEKQIALLQTFADQAVIAIGNVHLFEEVQTRTRELSKSLDDLRTAQDRLVQTEKLASLGQLTAGIAHEIKNPLNFVNNFAALSAELTEELNDTLTRAEVSDRLRVEIDELTGLLRDNLQKIVQHGRRADSIVKNMLLHSRESSGERRSADINALVGEALNLAYHGARAEKAGFNINLQSDFAPDAGKIDLYPQEMTRALLNLMSNGFYATTKRKAEACDGGFEPALTVTTRKTGEAVEIRIRDNGTGISPEVREKMFNPFFTTKPTGEGTGLGLSMTHDIIVKQHGGQLDVETNLGEFTEFIITLPRSTGLR